MWPRKKQQTPDPTAAEIQRLQVESLRLDIRLARERLRAIREHSRLDHHVNDKHEEKRYVC